MWFALGQKRPRTADHLEARKPRYIVEAGFYKPMQVLPIVVGQNEVVASGLGVTDHISDRLLNMLRVSNAQNFGTVERFEIMGQVGQCRVGGNNDCVELRREVRSLERSEKIIAAARRKAVKRPQDLI